MFSLIIDNELSLALVAPNFAKSYYDIVSKQKEYLNEWLAWPAYADSEDFFLIFIEKALHDYAEGKSLTCAILYNNEVVGNISFNKILKSLKKVEIGYWLSQDFQGKGIVSKSVAKFIELAFQNYDVEVVQISVAVENLKSRKICERLGLKLDGIISNSENLNGRIVDHAIYSLRREK